VFGILQQGFEGEWIRGRRLVWSGRGGGARNGDSQGRAKNQQ
jgi:hypothetical protein